MPQHVPKPGAGDTGPRRIRIADSGYGSLITPQGAAGNDATAPGKQRLVEGLKATADSKRHLDARRKRAVPPEGQRQHGSRRTVP